MKNQVIFLAFMLITQLAICQSSALCVTCDNNLIDTTKFSSAVGSGNISTGINSFTSGFQNQATGNYSFASGYECKATSDYSVAMPFFAKAYGNRSLAFGYYSSAYGNGSLALGIYSHTGPNASSSIAIGSRVSTQASYSMVLGYCSDDTLKNTIEKSLMIGFESNLPTLFVGTSAGTGKTGKIGIGDVTDPQSKLHIKADVNEDASLKLETSGSSDFALITFADDEHSIKAKTGSDMTFSTPTDKNFVFTNGKVGVATANPQAMLHVNGDLQVGDEENPQPIRFFGSINAEGEHAVSFGTGNSATGEYSFASGLEVHATGSFAFAHGKYITVGGANSLVLGKYAETQTSPAMIIGYGANNTARLTNGVPNSLMIGLNSDKSTLFVGPSLGIGTTGRVGIGNVTDPQAKLHIKADLNEDASLKLETSGSSNFASIAFADDEHYIKAKTGSDMTFSTPTDMDYVFENGNIGVDTYNPVAKLQIKNGDIFIEDIDRGIVMKSPDGNCWRGKLDNNGALQFVQVNCDDLATGQEELKPGSMSQVNIYPNPAGNRVFVSIDPQLSGALLEISDVNGNLVHSEKLFNADSFIDLTDFTSGLYIFQINDKTGKAVKSEKVIKN